MENSPDPGGFIPKHGGYRNLKSYQKAEIIYDGTVYFANRFISIKDRTHDQMVQAARSGKQNIAEGSMASAMSKEFELKLTSIARASIEELCNDYEDFLRTRKLEIWNPEHRLVQRFKVINATPNANYSTFQKAIEHPDPEISANVLRCLTRVTIYLLGKQLQHLEQAFVKEGGIRERMVEARLNYRRKRKQ